MKRKLKQLIVNSFGGKCQICGYNKCLAALDFHHTNPIEKDFNISKYAKESIITYEMAKELTKCILVCSNCHRQIHQGLLKKEIEDIAMIDLEEFL